MRLLSLKPNRKTLPLCGLLLPLFLSGCQSTENIFSGLRENEILRNAARGVLMGKAYDQVAIAQRNQDSKALQAATAELSRIDPLAAAEKLVQAALKLDMNADSNSDVEQKRKQQAQAAQKYREALRISPQFPSQSPNLLNALGYFLADKGTSQKDFQTAERLTRQALKQWDTILEQLKDVPLADKGRSLVLFSRAQGPQDSLAWALFKQKKFDEAAKVQKDALKTTEEAASALGEKIAADLYYHYAEIERACGDNETARTNYQIALQLEPKHKASQDALRTLPPAKPKPIEPAVPEPSPAPQTIPSPQPGLTA